MISREDYEAAISLSPRNIDIDHEKVEVIAVRGDNLAQKLIFKCPIEYDDEDLSTKLVFANYQTPSGYRDRVPLPVDVEDIDTDEGVFYFCWELDEYVCSRAETVEFSISFENPSAAEKQYALYTRKATFEVQDTVCFNGSVRPEDEESFIELTKDVAKLKADVTGIEVALAHMPVGQMELLLTTDKSSVVGAINEVYGSATTAIHYQKTSPIFAIEMDIEHGYIPAKGDAYLIPIAYQYNGQTVVNQWDKIVATGSQSQESDTEYVSPFLYIKGYEFDIISGHIDLSEYVEESSFNSLSDKVETNESNIAFILNHTRPILFEDIEWTPGSISGADGRIFDSTTHLRTVDVDMIEYHNPFFILNPDSLNIMPVEYTSTGAFVSGHAESTAPIIMINPSENGGFFRLQYYAGRTLVDADYEAVKSLSFVEPTEDYYEHQTEFLMPSLSMFPTFGVIGDSYASGVVALDSDFEDKYPQSWGQMLAKKTGTKCTNFSHTGLTTGTWLTHEKGLAKLQAEDAKHIYYLCLGINDHNAGMSYLGVPSDIGTNADTFYGNYSKIITAIQTKAPNAKIIMFTITECSSSDKNVVNTFNTAIINIANHYHIPYIVQDDDYLLQTDWYSGQLYRGHPRTYTYAAMANAYERLIQKCIYDNYSYFADYQITTAHSGVDDDEDEITILQNCKQDKTTIVSDSTSQTANIEMVNNTEKRFGEITSLTMTLPSTLPDDYISSVVFTSGSTATVITPPANVKFTGEDCTSGTFTPVSNKRYTLILSYDGVYVSGIVGGVSTT